MLAHVLAMVVGLASFSLYMAAFFFPEVHRKYDFAWSGVGMFYALVLWVCAGRITGGVLLGQTASVALLGWLGWQMFSLRRSLTPIDQQTTLPGNVKTIGEAIQLKVQELRSRSRNLRLPNGFNRWLRQSGNWLSQATLWIQDKLGGIQKTKRRSPVTVPPPIKPVSVQPLPTRPNRELETAELETASELETMLVEEIAEEEVSEIVESVLEEIDEVKPTDKTEAIQSDSLSVEVLSVEVLSVEVVEPIAHPPTSSVNRPIAKLRSRQQNNLLTSIRNRVQSTLDSLSQRNVKSAAANLRLSDQSSGDLDDLDDDDFEDEPIELEITTAVLEDKVGENRDGEDKEDIVVVKVVDDAVEVVEDAVEAIAALEPPLPDDISALESPEFVIIVDTAIEAEIHREAATLSDEPDSTPSSPTSPVAPMPDIPPTPNP